MSKRNSAKMTVFILAAFSCSGAAALIYEVIWTRSLSLVLGSTVYALSTMLATFMCGLAIGSYFGGKLSDKSTNLIFCFALCEIGIGVLGLASIPLIYALPERYIFLYKHFHLYPGMFFTMQILLCFLVMLLPTTLMGATFPLVARTITSDLGEMGKKVGDAYSLNTIGSVFGSLLAGFYLIPKLGINGATLFAACLNLAVGISMLLYSRKNVTKTIVIALPVFVIAALWEGTARLEASLINFYSASQGISRGANETDNMLGMTLGMKAMQSRQVFYEEHLEGPVRAFKMPSGHLILQVGGKVEGTGAPDMTNTTLLAYLPLASHPAPKSFLTIGLGAGVTLAAAKEQLKDTDVVEINPGVIKAVSLHGKPGVLDDVTVIVNDARNYLLFSEKRYDIISSEPSYPTESGVAGLFTREFYEIASSRLNVGGVYCQWLPYYILSRDDVTIMLKTFGTVFQNVHLWKVPESEDLILIGSRKPFAFTPEEIRQRVDNMNLSHQPLNYAFSPSSNNIQKIVQKGSIPINTDDLPIIEFNAVNNLLLGSLAEKNREHKYKID